MKLEGSPVGSQVVGPTPYPGTEGWGGERVKSLRSLGLRTPSPFPGLSLPSRDTTTRY